MVVCQHLKKPRGDHMPMCNMCWSLLLPPPSVILVEVTEKAEDLMGGLLCSLEAKLEDGHGEIEASASTYKVV